jgi:mRNA interferase MazF
VEPLRGEVWNAHVRGAGTHPFVILTVNPVIARLGAVTAALMTGTAGPRYTHIPLGTDAGLTEYAESYANATHLHTIPKPKLHRRLTAPTWMVAPAAMQVPSAPPAGWEVPQ